MVIDAAHVRKAYVGGDPSHHHGGGGQMCRITTTSPVRTSKSGAGYPLYLISLRFEDFSK